MYLPSNDTVATRGRLFSVLRNLRKAFYLEKKSSAYTPKSAFLNFLWISHSIKVRNSGVGLFWQLMYFPLQEEWHYM